MLILILILMLVLVLIVTPPLGFTGQWQENMSASHILVPGDTDAGKHWLSTEVPGLWEYHETKSCYNNHQRIVSRLFAMSSPPKTQFHMYNQMLSSSLIGPRLHGSEIAWNCALHIAGGCAH